MAAVAHLTKTPEAQEVLLLAVVAVERVVPFIVIMLYLLGRLAGSVAFIPQPKREAARPQGWARLEPLARPLSDEGRVAAVVAVAIRLELAMLVAQVVRLEEAVAVVVVALRQEAQEAQAVEAK